MTGEQVEHLLSSDEVETIERKSSLDDKEIRKALVAFANDLAGRGCSWIIVGQAPDKKILGLNIDPDEAQRKVSDIARNQCSPAIAPSIEPVERDGKTILIIEVRASVARPHCVGKAWVRIGSTTRLATDAEIMALRHASQNPKAAYLIRCLAQDKTSLTLREHAQPGHRLNPSFEGPGVTLLEVTENWITLEVRGNKRAVPFSDFGLGYDYQNDRPLINHFGPARSG